MSVRAKVTCNGIEGNRVTFSTVYEPDASKDTENARFTQATPWGRDPYGHRQPGGALAVQGRGVVLRGFHASAVGRTNERPSLVESDGP